MAKTTFVRTHLRKTKSGIAPVTQHLRVGVLIKDVDSGRVYTKEEFDRMVKAVQKPWVKPQVSEKFRVAVASLKMGKIK